MGRSRKKKMSRSEVKAAKQSNNRVALLVKGPRGLRVDVSKANPRILRV